MHLSLGKERAHNEGITLHWRALPSQLPISRVTGHVVLAKFHMYGNRGYQDIPRAETKSDLMVGAMRI